MTTRKSITHATPSFGGFGKDLCRICGLPTVNHELAPCPQLGLEVIHVPHVQRATPTGKCRRCKEPAMFNEQTNRVWSYCSDYCRKKYQTEKRSQP